jgi:isopentenyl diphosphate isomerase/L-lactate dehydrogenase-like FMN-dependent dehydrogenase
MERFHTVCDFEREAVKHMTQRAMNYYQAGANGMTTLNETEAAFGEIKMAGAAEVDRSAGISTKLVFMG